MTRADELRAELARLERAQGNALVRSPQITERDIRRAEKIAAIREALGNEGDEEGGT